jgi:hypothetical protein
MEDVPIPACRAQRLRLIRSGDLRATGAAKLGLLRALCECVLGQTLEAVLLPLNPEDVLDFLPGTRARNFDVQERASDNLVAREPACQLTQLLNCAERLIR